MALTKISRGLLDTGVSDSSDATAITISSSEQVMIGTTDAGYPDYGDSLTVADVDGGGGNAGMTIRSGTSSYGTFYFSDATGTAAGTYAGKMQYNHSNNSMVFGTNSADRLTIDSSGNVGSDTQQTLTNKTILIDEDNFVLVDGTEEAIFQINWTDTISARRSYFLPDAGTVTTTAEPTATASTLIDTKSEQTLLTKTLVDLKLAANAEAATNYAIFNTSALTANRTLTVPDLSMTFVGTTTTQTISNKLFEGLLLVDNTDATKKVSFNVANVNTGTNELFRFPNTDSLNRGADTYNMLITEKSAAELFNKTLNSPVVTTSGNTAGQVTLSAEGITGPRTIKFPDADATLLSTENVTLDDVTFGAGIGANNLTGLTRQQQFFYSGF